MQTRRSISAPSPGAMINEALTPLEFPRLAFQAPRLALAPRGSGERILVWPGFGVGDSSTALLRAYLSYLGYRPRGWGLGQNNADVLRLLDVLRDQVQQLAAGERVSIIGWSLGGYLAREVARDCPDLVSRVITLGSPVVGGPKYTTAAAMFDGVDEIEALVDARYDRPLTVPVTAIYSKLDGVVAWQACIDERSPNIEHLQVTSTHIGLGFSPDVLRIVADRLADT